MKRVADNNLMRLWAGSNNRISSWAGSHTTGPSESPLSQGNMMAVSKAGHAITASSGPRSMGASASPELTWPTTGTIVSVVGASVGTVVGASVGTVEGTLVEGTTVHDTG